MKKKKKKKKKKKALLYFHYFLKVTHVVVKDKVLNANPATYSTGVFGPTGVAFPAGIIPTCPLPSSGGPTPGNSAGMQPAEPTNDNSTRSDSWS